MLNHYYSDEQVNDTVALEKAQDWLGKVRQDRMHASYPKKDKLEIIE